MKSQWMNHNGKSYFYCDYSGFKKDTAAFEEELKAVESALKDESPRSVLWLVNVSDTVASAEVTRIIKDSAKRVEPITKYMAVIGVAGVVRVIAEGVAKFSGTNLKLFDDAASAKEWLVSQPDRDMP